MDASRTEPRDPYTPSDTTSLTPARRTAVWWLVLLGLLIALVVWDMNKATRQPTTEDTTAPPPANVTP